MAHQISFEKENKIGPFNKLQVDINNFEHITKKYSDYSKDSLSKLEYKDSNPNAILYTFDDGYRDNLINALPILERYNAPCIVFITTGFIEKELVPYEIELANIIESLDSIETPDFGFLSNDSKEKKQATYERLRSPLKKKNNLKRQQYIHNLLRLNSLNKNEFQKCEMLTWEDILYLDRHPLVTIGAHSHTHPMLNKISILESYNEIKKSKEILEYKLGHSIDYFSYPYGANSFITKWLVKYVGFKYAFTTKPEVINNMDKLDMFSIPRIDMNNYEMVMDE